MKHDPFNNDIKLSEVKENSYTQTPFEEDTKFRIITSKCEELFADLEEAPEYQNLLVNLVREIKTLGSWLQDAETLLTFMKQDDWGDSDKFQAFAEAYFEAKKKFEEERPKPAPKPEPSLIIVP